MLLDVGEDPMLNTRKHKKKKKELESVQKNENTESKLKWKSPLFHPSSNPQVSHPSSPNSYY